MFEVHGDDEPPDVALDALAWESRAAPAEPDATWPRRSSEVAIQKTFYGARFEVHDRDGNLVATGHRLTVQSAKRAAKRAIRHARARPSHDDG